MVTGWGEPDAVAGRSRNDPRHDVLRWAGEPIRPRHGAAAPAAVRLPGVRSGSSSLLLSAIAW